MKTIVERNERAVRGNGTSVEKRVGRNGMGLSLEGELTVCNLRPTTETHSSGVEFSNANTEMDIKVEWWVDHRAEGPQQCEGK